MKRANTLLENISKLNTYIHMAKSSELLEIYIEKITNKKSKSIKFVNEFDYLSLDLLYTSLEIMYNKEKISHEEFNKIDKGELKYYFNKVKGINYFKKQVPSLKTEEAVVDYLRSSLANGKYILNNNSTIVFDNGLTIDSDWLVDFAHFLITSLNNNVYLSNDSKSISIKVVDLPEYNSNPRLFIKDIKVYEYVIYNTYHKKLTFDNVKYLRNIVSTLEHYDFKTLQQLNSKLAKEDFCLSINKQKAVFSNINRQRLENLINEKEDNFKVIEDFIKEALNCYHSNANKTRRILLQSFEYLRSLTHAYKNSYTLNECRKLFDISLEEIEAALAISKFYMNYIYDEENLMKHFNYAVLNLDEIKPTTIDYETPEYKTIINNLSKLNKKIVLENRKINSILAITRKLPKASIILLKDQSKELAEHCTELEKLVKESRALRDTLELEKDENHNKTNINKAKIKYIKDAILEGRYSYDKDTSLLTFDSYSKKDYHQTFHLDITLDKFNKCILSEHNRNVRINFYQL